MGVREEILAVLPEIGWIEDDELQGKVVRTWELALERGGWQSARDIERIPFTLLKAVDINFAQHVRSVTHIALKAWETFRDVLGGAIEIDRDILLAGALLHDVGKMLEITEKDGRFQRSEDGKLVRHPFSGMALADACGLPAEVLHMIGTHSKEGDPFKRTPASVVVHYADFMNFDTIES